MKNFRVRDLFLISLSGVLMFTVWAGCCRVLGIQTRILPDTRTDLRLILGRTSAFRKPTLHRIFSGIFQERLENAIGDSLPFLEQVIPLLTYWKSLVYELSLEALPKSWSPVLPVGGKDYVRIRGKERLLPTPDIYNPEKVQQQMPKVANYYNKIATRWPGVRFYVFAIPRAEGVLAETGVWTEIPTQLLLGSKAVKQFETLLLNSVAYGWAGKARPAGEVLGCYYNTDHHLTMPGAYEAYRQVYHLISARLDVGKVVQCKNWFIVPGVIFRGSRSRLSGGYERATDKLVDGLFVLPHYKVTIHGAGQDEGRDKRLQYKSGDIPSSHFVNHYSEYFGGDHGLVEYVADQVSRLRNLLVIGDSFKNSMEPLIAAHFCHTYFVDLRHFENDLGRSFDLDAFIAQNGITDVLFIEDERILVTDPETYQDAQAKAD